MQASGIATPRLDSEAMGCSELLGYTVYGKAWNEFRQGFKEAVEDKRGFILVYGFYGSGKTLFVRRVIAEYTNETNLIVPIYAPLRRLSAKSLASPSDVILATLDYMLERLKRGLECGGEWLRKQLQAARHEVSRRRSANSYIELLEYLSARLEPIPVLVLDELETLVTNSRQAVWAPTDYKSFAEKILELLSEAYNLASGGRGYFVVVLSVYKLSALILELSLQALRWAFAASQRGSVERVKLAAEAVEDVARLAVEKIGGLVHPSVVRDAFHLVELARSLRAGGNESHLGVQALSESLARFYMSLLDYQEMPGDVLEPGLTERLGPRGLVTLLYTGEDYAKMAEALLGSSLDEEEKSVYEKLRLPPRILVQGGQLKSKVISGIAALLEAATSLRSSGREKLTDGVEVVAHPRRRQRIERIVSLLRVYRRRGVLRVPLSTLLADSGVRRKTYVWLARVAKLLEFTGEAEDLTLGPTSFYPAVVNAQHPWVTSLSARDAYTLALIYTTYYEEG